MRFDNWYSASSVCTPSRYSLMTGRYPNRSHDRLLRALGFGSPRDVDRGIRPGETTIAAALARVGYRTAIVGKWHLGHADPKFLPTRHGFESFYGFTGGCVDYFTLRYGDARCWYRNEELVEESGYATELLTDEAVRFLEHDTGRRPFLLYLPYNAPHYGKGWDMARKQSVNVLQPAPKYLERVARIPAGPRRDYAAMVVAMDDGVGRVMDALGRRGLERSTLVLWLSDNGAMLDYGGSNYPHRDQIGSVFEGGIHVPAVARWPGRIEAGVSTAQLASTLDVFPTLCRLAGVTPRGGLDGIDLSPALLERVELARDLFWLQDEGDAAFRRGPFKYVRTKQGEEFLFHLRSDPGERVDLAPVLPATFAELKAEHARLARRF